VLWTIAVILLALWVLGMAMSYTASGLIHFLLAASLVIIAFRLIFRRSVAS
jgi:hypothetical protein